MTNPDLDRALVEVERHLETVNTGQCMHDTWLRTLAAAVRRLQGDVERIRAEWDAATSREASTFAELKERRFQVARLQVEAEVGAALARKLYDCPTADAYDAVCVSNANYRSRFDLVATVNVALHAENAALREQLAKMFTDRTDAEAERDALQAQLDVADKHWQAEIEAQERGLRASWDLTCKERDALREQVAEREDAAFKAGWNAGKACHTGIATLTEARAVWRARQKGTHD